MSNIAGFGESMLSLVELQARLAVVELKQNLAAMKLAMALVVGAAALSGASLVVGLMGIAEVCASTFALSRGFCLLAVAAASLVLAGLGLAVGAAKLDSNRARFRLSREEFERNMQWIRTVLCHSGRSSC